MSTLGHLAELDTPFHNNKVFLLKEVLVLGMGGVESSIMVQDNRLLHHVLQATYPAYGTFKCKTSRNQIMNQGITKVLLFATFYSLQPERRGQPQGIKALFTACQVPSVQLFLEPHLIQRPSQPITLLNTLGVGERGLFSTNKGCCQQLHHFVSLNPLLESYFFDVDKLADIHVIISLLDIRPYRLNHLADHGYNNIPPGQ